MLARAWLEIMQLGLCGVGPTEHQACPGCYGANFLAPCFRGAFYVLTYQLKANFDWALHLIGRP